MDNIFSSTGNIIGIVSIAVSILIPIVIAITPKFRNFFLDICAQIFSVRLHTKRYYDNVFMTKRIKKAKKTIRVVCVRNQRISETDVVDKIREFIENQTDNIVEIYAISPKLDDCVLEQIMLTLPSPPLNVQNMKDQIEQYKSNLKSMVSKLSENNKRKICYYEYKALPLIHLCQFDKNIYMGYQMFQRTEQENESLLKYAVKMRTNTKIGKLLLKQMDNLKNDSQTEKINLT